MYKIFYIFFFITCIGFLRRRPDIVAKTLATFKLIMDHDVKLKVGDVSLKSSVYLKNNFNKNVGVLKDLPKAKLSEIRWEKLVQNPEHWDSIVLTPPIKKKGK